MDVAGLSSTTSFLSSDSLTLNGNETNLSNGLRFLKEQYVNRNIQGAVLISDGIYNAGSNPEYATEMMNTPIYTVGLGDSQEYADFKIEEVAVNSIAYLEMSFLLKWQ